MKKKILFIFFILTTYQSVYANILFTNINVLSFECKKNGEYKLIFKSNDNFWERKSSNNGIFVLNIRFNPDCVTELIQSKNIEIKKKRYQKAVIEIYSDPI